MKANSFLHIPSRAIIFGYWKIQEDEGTFWTQDHYMEWFLAGQKFRVSWIPTCNNAVLKETTLYFRRSKKYRLT